MNYRQILLTGFLLLSTSGLFAQSLPATSPKAAVMQRVGITDITITYFRPSVNEREVWGKLIAYKSQGPVLSPHDFSRVENPPERPWRAGANNATTIEFTHDVMINNHPVKAGKYAFFIKLIEDDEAEIILSSRWDQWGSFFYDQTEDVLRFKVKMENATHNEQLKFEFNDVTSSTVEANLLWEKKKIPFDLEVNTVDIVSNQLIADAYTIQNPSWFVTASTYLMNNRSRLDIAEEWASRYTNAPTPNFTMLSTYANILALNGKKEKANETLDKALELAEETGFRMLSFYGNQTLNLELPDFAIKTYNTIKDTFPDSEWIAYSGLALGYSMKGDYKEALKLLKKAKSFVPENYDMTKLETRLDKLKKGEDIN